MQKKGFLFIVIIIVAIFLGVGVLLSNISNQFSGPPALVVSEEVGDLGAIKPDQEQIYVFTLKNEGGETLIIERLQATCGCTATVLSQEEILPGKTIDLEVTFNPRGYEGEVSKSIYIYTNDPENQRKKIAIRANVEHIPSPEVQLSTNQWDLGLLSRGDSANLGLIVSNQGDLELSIETIDVPEYIHYDREIFAFPRQLEPEESIEIPFTYDSSEHEIGITKEYIRLVTNDPKRENVTLRIEGYIHEKENAVSIYPLQSIFISTDDEKEEYEAKFLLKNNSKDILQLVSVQSSVDYLETINKEMILSPGEEQEIVIRLDQGSIANLYINEKLQGFIYLNIALPVSINPGLQ